MNKVVLSSTACAKMTTVDALCMIRRHTAFVGQCGSGPEHSLYLIAYGQVIQADKPRTTWSGACPVTIDRYVDVEIREIPLEEN
jgi:hypothetical protein